MHTATHPTCPLRLPDDCDRMTVDRIYFWLFLHHFSLISVPFILLTSLQKPIRCLLAQDACTHSDPSQILERDSKGHNLFRKRSSLSSLYHRWAVPLYACWMNPVYQSVIRSCRVRQQWAFSSLCKPTCHCTPGLNNKDGPRPVWQSFGPEDGAVTCPLQPRLYLCCQFSLYAHRAAVEWAEVWKSEGTYTHTHESFFASNTARQSVKCRMQPNIDLRQCYLWLNL